MARMRHEATDLHDVNSFTPEMLERQLRTVQAIAGLLRHGDAVILDTETTGLGHAEVIEVSVIDMRGEVLFDQMIRPRRMEMNPYAYRVHGISLDALTGMPTFPEITPELDAILDRALVLAWNAPFDSKMINNSRAAWGLAPKTFLYRCAMELYGRLYGRRSIGLHKAIRAAGLDSALEQHVSHRALGDVRLVLELLRSVETRFGGEAEVEGEAGDEAGASTTVGP